MCYMFKTRTPFEIFMRFHGHSVACLDGLQDGLMAGGARSANSIYFVRTN